MSRNSGGTYSLPSGPVSAGTTISSSRENTLEGDLATELTDSLSRSGKGGMLAPVRGVDGTVAAPSVSFTSETGSGLYRVSAGVIGWAILGVWRILANATGALVHGTWGIQDVTGGKTTTLSSPSGLAADQTITFPTALPGSTLPVSLSAAGAMSCAALTRPQLPAVGQQVASVSTGGFSTSSATYVDVTNATITITTTGRPVVLLLQPDGTSNAAYVGTFGATSASSTAFFKMLRAGSDLAVFSLKATGTDGTDTYDNVPPGLIHYVDVVGAGTYTYKLQAKRNGAADTAEVFYSLLVAYEL